jgi:hypothetical protein
VAIAGAVVVALALIGAVAFLLLRGYRQRGQELLAEEANAAPAAVTDAVPVSPVAPPPPASGRVVVDAVPWGEVLQITAADGQHLELPDSAATPIVLELPPGDYFVQIARPGAAESAGSCQLTVEPSSMQLCRVELQSVASADYFKEAGWWP